MPAADMYRLPSHRSVHPAASTMVKTTNTNCCQIRQKQIQFKMAKITHDLLDPQSKSLSDFSSVGAKEVQAQHLLWGLPHANHLKATVVFYCHLATGDPPNHRDLLCPISAALRGFHLW